MPRLILLLLVFSFTSVNGQTINVLTYHDVVPNAKKSIFSVSRSSLVAQLDYLESTGYVPISLSLLDNVRNGRAKLPKKAILLTFDDGLKSYYDFVWPLLKIYGYPSVVSVVSAWIDGKEIPPEYRGKLMSWKQLQALKDDRNVELISHTHNMHRSIISNPQGNAAPASYTRQYFPVENTYETEKAFSDRIYNDLAFSVQRFNQMLGFSPRAIAWPYGYYDSVMVEEASKLGMIYQLTLDDRITTIELLPQVNRRLVFNASGIDSFIAGLNYLPPPERRRFVEIDLDDFSGKTLVKQDKILSKILDNLVDLNVDMVVVNPFNKNFTKAFFVSSQIKLDVDVLNRVLHQIKHRVDIDHIYLNISDKISVSDKSKLFSDLARLNRFNGIIFESKINVSDRKLITQRIKRFLPGIRVGIRDSDGTKNDLDGAEFVVSSVDFSHTAQEIQTELTKLSGIPMPVYVSLGGTNDNDTDKLLATIRTIKAMGVQNYGFDLGKLSTQSDSKLWQIAKKILKRGK